MSVGLCVGLCNADDDRDNREPRVDNGSTSTNGITLFKATSSILCKIIQQILYNCPNLVLSVVLLLEQLFGGNLSEYSFGSPGNEYKSE